jgi:hypothetical protein
VGSAPRECTFDFNDDGSCYITHGPSGSSFVVEGPFGSHTTIAVVGEGAPRQLDAYIWPRVEERAERWARDIKRDVDTPDLLAELEREREILTGTRYEEVGNTSFTSEEIAEIAEQLRQIKEHVSTAYALSEAQMLHLEEKLDDIAAAASRMGRKDWALWVSGALLGDPAPSSCPGHRPDDGRRPGLPSRRRGYPAAASAYGVASRAATWRPGWSLSASSSLLRNASHCAHRFAIDAARRSARPGRAARVSTRRRARACLVTGSVLSDGAACRFARRAAIRLGVSVRAAGMP